MGEVLPRKNIAVPRVAGPLLIIVLPVVTALATGCSSKATCARGPAPDLSGTMEYCGPSGCTKHCPEDATWSGVRRIETWDEFDRLVLRSDRPAIVTFYTHRCEYCEALAAKVLRLAGDFGDSLGFFCVCRADSEAVVEPFHLRGYPTVILFRDGEEAHRWLGDRPEADYRTELDALRDELAAGRPREP